MKAENFKVLKTFTAERVYAPNETISLNNKKQIEYLKANKFIK